MPMITHREFHTETQSARLHPTEFRAKQPLLRIFSHTGKPPPDKRAHASGLVPKQSAASCSTSISKKKKKENNSDTSHWCSF